MAIAVMMFAVVGHVGKAEASFLTGAQLLQECESDSAADRNVCIGSAMGIVDVTRTYVAGGELNKLFCMPEGTRSIQPEKVVIKELNAEPEDLHISASGALSILGPKSCSISMCNFD